MTGFARKSFACPSLLKHLLAAAWVTCALAAMAQSNGTSWQWRGADGSINVSDRPPPREVPDKDILKRPGPDAARKPAQAAAAQGGVVPGAAAASAPTTAPPTALEREVQARKRAAEQDKQNKAKAEDDKLAAQRASNCRAAKSQVASLESGMRIARTNEKGEREILDDQARSNELRRAREVLSSDCR
jgi:hypothetical protein